MTSPSDTNDNKYEKEQLPQEEAVPEDVLVDYDDDDEDEAQDGHSDSLITNSTTAAAAATTTAITNAGGGGVPSKATDPTPTDAAAAAAADVDDDTAKDGSTMNCTIASRRNKPTKNSNQDNTTSSTSSTPVSNTQHSTVLTAGPSTGAAANPTRIRGERPASSVGQGGIYIPPFRRRLAIQTDVNAPVAAAAAAAAVASSPQHSNQVPENANAVATQSTATIDTATTCTCSTEYQRQHWYQLQKNIRGTINRLNTQTLKPLLLSILQKPHTNLIRGKGILAKSIIRSATISPSHAPVYASFLAVLHSKLPEIGELVLTRSILLFRKSYARQDRDRTLALANFIGCLFNQGMCHEILCLQMLTLLLAEDDATDESVEVAIRLVQVVGRKMMECSPAGLHAVMERFRSLLHEGESAVSQRVQLKLQNVLELRKRKFEEFPTLVKELDLVEVEDQIMLEMGLDDEDLDMEDHLDVFQFDENWETNEKEWLEIQKEILGHDPEEEEEGEDGGESETDDGTTTSQSEDDEEEEDEDEEGEDGVLVETTTALTTTTATDPSSKAQTIIQDMSEKDLIHLRRTIYLTIMSSATFEECAHKLSKMDIPPGKEMELINMIIECCSQERTFLRYYGLIASRFCLLHNRWKDAFHQAFIVQYNTIHRLETNKLRNVAKLFAHLLHTDSLPWSCLSVIHLNEDETTSSSRIFLKILVQEMAQAMGMEKLLNRFETKDPEAAVWFQELFPRDPSQPRKTRYAINFFTSIGLGPLTDGLREHLKQAPKLIRMQAVEASMSGGQGNGMQDGGDDEAESDISSVLSSSSSSISSSTSSDSSSTDSSSYSSSSLSSSSESYTSDSYRRRKRPTRQRSDSRRRRNTSYSNDSSTSSNDSVSSSSRQQNRKQNSSRHSRRRQRRHDTKRKRSPSRSRYRRSSPRSSSISSSSSSSFAREDGRKDSRRDRNRHHPTTGRSSRDRDASRDKRYHEKYSSTTISPKHSSLNSKRSPADKKEDHQTSPPTYKDNRQDTTSRRRHDNKRRRSVSESSSGSFRSSDSSYDSRRYSHSRRKRRGTAKGRDE